MTEKEWLRCKNFAQMLRSLPGRQSERKLRLFAVGCSRHVWKDLTPVAVRRAVETSERYADGAATESELEQAHQKGIVAFLKAFHGGGIEKMEDPVHASKIDRIAFAVDLAPIPLPIDRLDCVSKDQALRIVSPRLFRCIVGNPFRTISLKRTCRTSTVASLAQTIYEKRAFSRLPILADALEEAGCTDAAILSHCRQPGEHVRGCWVVDLLLNKE